MDFSVSFKNEVCNHSLKVVFFLQDLQSKFRNVLETSQTSFFNNSSDPYFSLIPRDLSDVSFVRIYHLTRCLVFREITQGSQLVEDPTLHIEEWKLFTV